MFDNYTRFTHSFSSDSTVGTLARQSDRQHTLTQMQILCMCCPESQIISQTTAIISNLSSTTTKTTSLSAASRLENRPEHNRDTHEPSTEGKKTFKHGEYLLKLPVIK